MVKEMDNCLLLTDCGYIRVKLGALLKEKGITVYGLSKSAQVNYAVVRRWYSNDRLEKLDTDVLARFCYVLKCDVSEIIEFVPREASAD